MDININMGKKIKKHRKKLGLTQSELGEKLEPSVNRSAIAKWENGLVKNIRRDHIEQMAQLFNISAYELLSFNTELEYTEDALDIARKYMKLNDSNKDLVVQMIQAMLFNQKKEDDEKRA